MPSDLIYYSKMKIRFKKLSPDAVEPTRAHVSDAGFDLTAIGVEEDRKRGIVTYRTGIAVEIPEGFVGLLFPKNNVYRHQLFLSDSVGVVGGENNKEIVFRYRIVQPHISRYTTGDVVGSILFVQIPKIDITI